MKWSVWGSAGAAILSGAVVVVWIGFHLATGPETPPDPAIAPKIISKGPGFPLTGTASCSARGCHGSLTPPVNWDTEKPIRFDEYTRWNAQDPHTRAYPVLFNARSQQIAKILNRKNAHEDPQCLACHVHPLAASPAATQLLNESSDSALAWQLRNDVFSGVGCEACHGPARDWLGPHATEGWKALTANEKKKRGMWPIQDVVARGKTCASCHVGAPPEGDYPLRDVNHDLLAAGHPRLQFELGTFLANLPPHWNVHAKKRVAANDAQTWALGQVVSAEMALQLLAYRAESTARHDVPWPEFAEYDCFACHHHLQPQGWRQRPRHPNKGKLGTLSWGSWYFTMPAKLATLKEAEALHALAKIMAEPYRTRHKVVEQTREALKKLSDLRDRLVKKPSDRDSLKKWLVEAVKQHGADFAWEWEAAEQLYLAGFAVQSPLGGPTLQKLRAFGSGFDSPEGFRPGLFLKALQP